MVNWTKSKLLTGQNLNCYLLKNFGKLTGRHLCQKFFLETFAHHQACNFIKKRLQHKWFTVSFTKLLKALCRTPQGVLLISIQPSKPLDCVRRISTFFQYYFLFWIFLNHFLFLIEGRNKSIWLYNKFSVKQALFLTSLCNSFLLRSKPVQRNYRNFF